MVNTESYKSNELSYVFDRFGDLGAEYIEETFYLHDYHLIPSYKELMELDNYLITDDAKHTN